MTLYELTQEAINQFDTYRYPNLSVWVEKIDEVLSALHESTIGGDKIENLYLSDDTLQIGTAYSVRSCVCSNDMFVPMSVLQAEDPVKEANRYYLAREYEKAQSMVRSAQADLSRAEQNLNNIKQLYEGAMQ